MPPCKTPKIAESASALTNTLAIDHPFLITIASGSRNIISSMNATSIREMRRKKVIVGISPSFAGRSILKRYMIPKTKKVQAKSSIRQPIIKRQSCFPCASFFSQCIRFFPLPSPIRFGTYNILPKHHARVLLNRNITRLIRQEAAFSRFLEKIL